MQHNTETHTRPSDTVAYDLHLLHCKGGSDGGVFPLIFPSSLGNFLATCASFILLFPGIKTFNYILQGEAVTFTSFLVATLWCSKCPQYKRFSTISHACQGLTVVNVPSSNISVSHIQFLAVPTVSLRPTLINASSSRKYCFGMV